MTPSVVVAAVGLVLAAAARGAAPTGPAPPTDAPAAHAPDCTIDAPAGWVTHGDATSKPGGRVVAHLTSLDREADAVTLFRNLGARPVTTAPGRVLMFLPSPDGGGEYDGAVDGHPACVVRVTYRDAADAAVARKVAGSVRCRKP